MTTNLAGSSQQVGASMPGKASTRRCAKIERFNHFQVIVSSFNKLEDGRYYDVESQMSFEFDHVTQVR